MRLRITEPAKQRVKEIFDYYCTHASRDIAKMIISKLKKAPKPLLENPLMGQQEPSLEALKKEHRYLMSGNYKIIYRIEEDIIYITDYFDTRQHPLKKRT